MKLSISEAARRAGVRRTTLYRKLDKGTLSKETGDDGKPVIDLAELVRVYPHAVTEPGRQSPPSLVAGRDMESVSLRQLVNVLKEDKERLQQQLDRAEAQHKEALAEKENKFERVLAMLENAQRQLTAFRPAEPTRQQAPAMSPPAPAPRSFWARLTGQPA